MTMKTRNDTLEFARRTRQNLEYIQRAYDKGEDVHPVTQLTVSLLGLVVFLKEKNFVNHIKKRTIEELTKDGWPKWQESKDNCPNLGHVSVQSVTLSTIARSELTSHNGEIIR